MTSDLQMWKPPTRDDVDKMTQYQSAVEQQNDLAITALVAEHRDTVMRQQLDVTSKFMNKINEHVDLIDDMSRTEQRKTLRSLAETMKVVSDVQAKAAMFDHVSKPQPIETGNNRISLFVNCVPVGVAPQMNGTIDVTAVSS